jgi:hypothetical protein
MTSLRSTLAWMICLTLMIVASAHATEALPEPASPDTVPDVTISSSSGSLPCDGRSPDEARRLAHDAQRAGAHSRAAACFRVAGDPVRADRAQMRASADNGAASAQRFKDSMETARAQAKRLRGAFRKS